MDDRPYYEDGTVTIYHGDCREIMPALAFDGIVSDPPYGIGHVPSSFWGKQRIQGDALAFDPAHLLTPNKPLILWGANHYSSRLPESPGWLVWNKRDRVSRNLQGSDAELAWTNAIQQVRIYTHIWIPHTMRNEPPYHPTQKPVALMRWCLSMLEADCVLDPYMGSGPVLRAAKDLGRKAIGVEIEERYCEIAAKRMGQEVLDLGV